MDAPLFCLNPNLHPLSDTLTPPCSSSENLTHPTRVRYSSVSPKPAWPTWVTSPEHNGISLLSLPPRRLQASRAMWACSPRGLAILPPWQLPAPLVSPLCLPGLFQHLPATSTLSIGSLKPRSALECGSFVLAAAHPPRPSVGQEGDTLPMLEKKRTCSSTLSFLRLFATHLAQERSPAPSNLNPKRIEWGPDAKSLGLFS